MTGLPWRSMGPPVRLTALVLAGLAGLTGPVLTACGNNPGTSATSSAASSTTPTSATPGSSPSATSGCATPARGGGPHIGGLVTEADSGRTFCLPVGATVAVLLQGSTDHLWAMPAVHGDPTTVASQPSGALALRVGVTGRVLRATAIGSVRLTSTRDGCPAAQPSCPTTWSVTLVVR